MSESIRQVLREHLLEAFDVASKLPQMKKLISKYKSGDDFDAAKLSGFGAKSSGAIVGIINAASHTKLDISKVKREVSAGGNWYFLYKVKVKDVDAKTHGEVTPSGKEDLSKPIVIDDRKRVLDGRHRVMLAKKQGVKELPAYMPAKLLYTELT